MKRPEAEYKHLAQMAGQFVKQGHKNKAARFYRLAGEQAAAQFASDEAVEYLSQALIWTPDEQVGQRFSLLLARERVYAVLGQNQARQQDLGSLEFLVNLLQNDEYRAEVAVRQGEYYLDVGHFETAVSCVQSAARFAQIARSSRLEAAAYTVWGKALIRLGNYDWAQTHLAQALQKAQTSTIRQLEADSIRAIGLLYLNQGDLTQARYCYLQAQEVYEEVGDNQGQCYTLNNLGHIAYNRKRFSEAQHYWEQALAAYQSIGDRLGQAMVYSNLGAVQMDVGNYSQAEEFNEDALALSHQVHSLMGQSMALANLALAKHYQDQQDQAYKLGQQALEIGQKMNNPRVQAIAFIPMAHALLDMGKPIEAQEAYWQSLSIWHELGQAGLVMEQRAGLARTFMAQSEKSQALNQVEEILSYIKGNGRFDGVESPFHIYMTVYRILREHEDQRAGSILEMAHAHLQEQANNIEEVELKQAFLENIAVHRQITAEYTEYRHIGANYE